jgi:hypothetical protein
MVIPVLLRERAFSAVVYTIVAVTVALAVTNLRQWSAVPVIARGASVMWLLLVGAMVLETCRQEGGPLQFVINRVASLFAVGFVEVVRTEGGGSVVRFGGLMFGCRFPRLEVRLDGIVSVGWHTGQASALAGRDMNDWSVVVWFDFGAMTLSKARRWPHRGQDVHCVGPSGPRAEAAELGARLVELLRGAGAALAPTEGGVKFVREERPDPATDNGERDAGLSPQGP